MPIELNGSLCPVPAGRFARHRQGGGPDSVPSDADRRCRFPDPTTQAGVFHY